MALQQTNSQVSTLQKQVKELTAERNSLKQKVNDFPVMMKQEHAELYRQLDEANAQKDMALAERDRLEATLKENQSGGDSLLRELQQLRREQASNKSQLESLEAEVASLRGKADDAADPKDGTFIQYRQGIIPAKCINLAKQTPSVKRAKGVVVVNCLINEQGDPVEVVLIQGLLSKETEWTVKAHEACLQAAKRLVFSPATTADGNIRVKVWQGVGFLLE
jgi:SMC interacting uncharacterized protein involved in chromosome segregation